MQCSYSKKAYPWDNACIESFHSLIKREWLNRFKIRDYRLILHLVCKCFFTWQDDVSLKIGIYHSYNGIVISHFPYNDWNCF